MAHEPNPTHEDCWLHSLPDELLYQAAASLTAQEKANWRLSSRRSRALINSGTTALQLNGKDLAYLSGPNACSTSGSSALCTFTHATTLRLYDDTGTVRQDEQDESGFTSDDFSTPLPPLLDDGAVTDELVEAFVEQACAACTTPSYQTSLGSDRCDAMQGRKALLARIQTLDLKGCAFLHARGMRHLIQHVPALHTLVATRWSGAAALMDLPTCSNLRTLALGDPQVDVQQVTDAALEVVASCTSLTELCLQRCTSITDAGLAALAALPRLGCLNIAYTQLTGQHLSALHALDTLDVSGCVNLRDDTLLAMAAQLQRLEWLRLEGSSCTNAGLIALPELPYLSCLLLGRAFELNDLGLAALSRCPQLDRLSLGNFNLTRPAPEGGFTALTQLKFGGSFYNRGLRHAFPLGPQLTHVVASGYDTVTDTHLSHLTRQTTLTHVELQGGYQLSSRGLQVLHKLPALVHLTVVSCPLVTSTAAEQLVASSPALQHVLMRKATWEPANQGQSVKRVSDKGDAVAGEDSPCTAMRGKAPESAAIAHNTALLLAEQ